MNLFLRNSPEYAIAESNRKRLLSLHNHLVVTRYALLVITYLE